YFSKPVAQLTLAEVATLAGIVPAPSLYSPLKNPKAAKERRDLVLQKMADEGFISQQEAQAAIASPLVTHPSQPKRLQRLAPYFTDYIQKQLPQYVSSDVLKTGGITVETTLNAKWQAAAETAVKNAVERYGRWQNFKQAALVAIDPRSGQIRAMVGGNDFDKNQFNRVTQAKRQPGSTFKTFVYTTAIAAGVSPNRSFLDAEYVVDGYKPENYGDKYSGSNMSMLQALARSVNVVAVQVLIKVGWKPVIEMAHKMGIESELHPTYSLALGASEVTLLELTSAYGTLANLGIHQNPYGISRILDRKGNVLYQAKFKPEEALDRDTTAIMTWMLRGVVNGGTGQAAQIGRPVAGKTGTSDKARDLWFVGFIPQLVAGVWLGNDNNQPTWGASTTAAVVWRQFMLEASQAMPIQSFPSLPNQIEGRKGTIKAEPIKPRRSYYTMPKPETASSQQGQVNASAGTGQTPRRRRRRR
ncbi:MAG: transglycosylase domain-containing protein, partial [Microcystaceae cyanobacterium]